MITLIAESKTMTHEQLPVSPEEFAAHTPVGETQAEEIIWNLREYTEEQIMEMLGCSATLARDCRRMIYGFADKLTGRRAIEAYTGVVFRQLGADSWSDEMLDFARDRLRIVSSLYGMLRPSDIVKPYRLDYTAKAAPGNLPLHSFWKAACTRHLASLMRADTPQEILNLLPADALKCIDRKLIKHFGPIVTPLFKECTPGGTLRTPPASKLKTMRGRLLREIVERRIDRAADLLTITDHVDFQPVASPDARDGFVWIC